MSATIDVKMNPQSAPLPITTLTDLDVLNGRGQGVQRNPGNIKYRKLVFVNKILYAKCPKGDKKKISKGIVDAVRELGGRFLELDEATEIYNDIGNKKATEKTSQALREGQTKVRKDMYKDPKYNASVQREMSANSYFVYTVQFLQSLCHAERTGDVDSAVPPLPPLADAVPTAVPSADIVSPDVASGSPKIKADPTGRRAAFGRQGGSRTTFSNSNVSSAMTPVTENISSISDSAHPAPSDRSAAMAKFNEQFSMAGIVVPPEQVPNEAPQAFAQMPPPPLRPPMGRDPSVGSMRFTNESMRFTDMSRMSLADAFRDTFSGDTVRQILETLRDSKESSNASGSPDDVNDEIRGSVEDVMGDIGDLLRYSEVDHMTMDDINDGIDADALDALQRMLEDGEENQQYEDEDEEVPLNDNNEIVMKVEENAFDRMSEMRSSLEEIAFGERGDVAEDTDLRLTDLSLMGASVMTIPSEDMSARGSSRGEF